MHYKSFVSDISSVGRAIPCQGIGHRFEPDMSLQFLILSDGFEVGKYGAMAEWLCCGLQIRRSRFDSGSRLHKLLLMVTMSNG